MANSCSYNSALNATRGWLLTRGVIDANMKILKSLKEFQENVESLTKMAKDKYGVDYGQLFTYEKFNIPKLYNSPYYREDSSVSFRAVPNMEAFDAILSMQNNRLQAGATVPSAASRGTLDKLHDFLDQVGVKVESVTNIVVNGEVLSANGLASPLEKLVQYVEGKEGTVLPEEAMHIAVALIEKSNPALYKELVDAVQEYDMYNKVVDEYSKLHTYQKNGRPDFEKLKNEAVAKVLVEHVIRKNEGSVEKPGNLKKVESLWSKIIKFFKTLFSTQHNPFELAANMVLNNEISPADFLTGESYLQAADPNLINELSLKYSDSTKLSKTIADFFNIVEGQIYRIGHNKALQESIENSGGTTRYSDLKSLLRAASEKGDSVEEMRYKIRQIANSLLFVQDFSKQMVEISEGLAKDSTLDVKDKISKLRYFLQLANNWGQFLDMVDKELTSTNPALTTLFGNIRQNFKTLENTVLSTDKSGVVEVLDEMLGSTRKTIKDLYEKEIDKLKAAIKAGKNVKANKALLANREAEFKKFDLSKDNIIRFLNGELGDTNLFSALFEAYISSPDPIIGGFAKFIKTNMYDVEATLQQRKAKMLNELDPLMKDVDRSDPKKLGEKLAFWDNIAGYDSDGNLTQEKVFTYLNEFKNYRYEIARLEDEVAKAKASGDNAAYLAARQALYSTRVLYMHNEYVPEYYARNAVFDNPVGQMAKAARDKVLADIQNKQFEINNKGFANEQDTMELEELWREYRGLHSNFDLVTGAKKTGDAALIAQALQEYKNNSKEFYEWVEVKGAYDRARTAHAEDIIANGMLDGTPEFVVEMGRWETANTRVVVDEKFYTEVRDPLIRIIDKLSAKLPNSVKKSAAFGEIWKEIFDHTSPFRDEDGQIDATAMTDTKIRKAKELEEKLDKLKQSFAGISGLTRAQSDRRSYLYSLAEMGVITEAQEDELELINQMAKVRGLSKAEKKAFIDAIDALKEVQSRVPSVYYVDAINELIKAHGYSVDASSAVDFVNSPVFENIMLSDHRAKQWFKDNHIEKTMYDKQLGDPIIVYEPLYVWSRVVPTDEKYMKRVPGYKYQTRQVKEKYRTARVVGETVDNRGRWLPRKGIPDSPFINQAYETLKNTDPTTFGILEIAKKYHLQTQEDAGRQHRLWLDVPRVRKHLLEGIRNGDIKEKSKWAWNKLKQAWTTQEDDYAEDYGNFDPQAADTTKLKLVSTDMFGNEFVMAPIKYTANIPQDQQTYDVLGATLKYMQSMEANKKLTEINPVAEAFRAVLSSEGVKDTKKISKFHKFKRNVNVFANKKKEDYIRLRAIDNIIEREFKGIENKNELGEFGNKVSQNLMALSAVTSLALDIPSAFKNVFSAHVQNIIEGIGHEFITVKDWWRGNGIFLKDYMPGLIQDNYKLGNKSLYTQMFQLFDPIQGKFLDTFGRETSASTMQDFVSGKWAFSARQFGELEAQGSLFLGAMSRFTVEQTLPDGTTTAVRYVDAFELGKDGVIRTKEGIDPEYAPGGKKFNDFKLKLHEINQRLQGNYAKADRTEIERYSTGRLVVFLRKYLVPAFVNRYAPSRINVGLSGVSKGYYRSFFDIGLNLFKTGKLNWSSYTDQERRGFMKAASEFGLSLAFLVLIRMMGFDPDDDDKFDKIKDNSWVYNHVLYQLMMVKSEEEQFIPLLGFGINELQRIKNTPSIAFGQMDRYITLSNDLFINDPLQLFTEEDITHFQRQTGFWEQGDRKDVAHFARVFGFTGNSINSEAAIRNYYLMSTRTK